MRDLRDPHQVGYFLQKAQESDEFKGWSLRRIWDWADKNSDYLTFLPDYNANPSCVDKYGTPADLEPKWAWIQVV